MKITVKAAKAEITYESDSETIDNVLDMVIQKTLELYDCLYMPTVIDSDQEIKIKFDS